MLTQKLQQKLLQKLSPQQILLIRMLQMPSIALEQRIKQEIEENPALEEVDDELEESMREEDEVSDSHEEDQREEDQEESYDEHSDDDDLDYDYYFEDDETPSYKLKANNTSPDDERKEIPFSGGITFHDLLITQVGLRDLSEEEEQIAIFLIGNLDDSGYLNRDLDSIVEDLAFTQNIQTNKSVVLEILKVIQDFDPPGVGARNLRECLLIQLDRMEDANVAVENARLLIQKYFKEFSKKHYEKILSRSHITEDELKDAIDIILTLNPKPGNSLSETNRTNQYVIPDFIIYNNNGDLELQLNNRFVPDLKVSKSYLHMLKTYGKAKDKNKHKDTVKFIKQKIDSAKWFIDAVRQRHNTLYNTMSAIMKYQKHYFLTGDDSKIRPMILKDIANIVDLDISTVSRVANSKYVQTPFGTFLLKSFFSESMTTLDGKEVSTREIKSILQDLIDEEDKSKPYTDEQLANKLKEKKYDIARRTIAKYREQLNIPVARLRKEL